MFEDIRQALRDLLSGGVPPNERRAVLAGMRDTLVHARMGLDDLRRGCEETRKRLEHEAREHETVERRRALAEQIGDNETATIAVRYAAHHAERIVVLQRKLESQEAELALVDSEVTEMTARADVAAVRAYRVAVGIRTREVVQGLRADAWAELVGDEDIKRAAVTGAFRDWIEGAKYPWLGWSRADQLASSALRHNAAHIGEAVTIRGLAGFGLGI